MKRHLKYAGTNRDIFTAGAVDEIYKYSSGTVRLVNKAATHSLIFGATNKYRFIDDHMVKRVIAGELT